MNKTVGGHYLKMLYKIKKNYEEGKLRQNILKGKGKVRKLMIEQINCH